MSWPRSPATSSRSTSISAIAFSEGQLLATLEIPEMQDDLTRAAAAIEEANAELATARDELQRAQSAHDMAHLSYSRILDVSKREPGLVPQQEVDEAHSRDLVAEAQVSAAKSHITACEQRIRVSQAEQARFKTLYQYAVITAPFTGVVTKRYANTGSLIQAGTLRRRRPCRWCGFPRTDCCGWPCRCRNRRCR